MIQCFGLIYVDEGDGKVKVHMVGPRQNPSISISSKQPVYQTWVVALLVSVSCTVPHATTHISSSSSTWQLCEPSGSLVASGLSGTK